MNPLTQQHKRQQSNLLTLACMIGITALWFTAIVFSSYFLGFCAVIATAVMVVVLWYEMAEVEYE